MKKTLLLSKRDRRTTLLFTCLGIGSLLPFLFYWTDRSNIEALPWLFFLSLVIISVQLLAQAIRTLILFRAVKPETASPPPDQRVAVLTTFVEGEASEEFVAQTLRGMVAIDYPHDSYLLDESDSDRLKELCHALGVKHFSRKGIPAYNQDEGPWASRTRFGNYNAWLDQIGFSQYDYVAVFDLDHIPEPNYLHETLGYFLDPQVGYVQAPQVYYNQDDHWISRAAAEKTFRYYSIGQMGRFGNDSTVLDGCHNVNRVSALKEIGGFQPHKADDLLTTLSYLAQGWKGIYVPKVLAQGQAPMDWRSYFIQQFQWAYTTLDIKFRYLPQLFERLNWRQKLMSLIHGASYLSGLTWAVTLGLLAYLIIWGKTLPLFDFPLLVYLIAPLSVRFAFFLWQQKFYICPERERGIPWRNYFASYLALPYYFWALVTLAPGDFSSFQVIPKHPVYRGTFRFFAPHLTLALLLLAIGSYFVSQSHDPGMGLLYTCMVYTIGLNLIPLAFLLWEDPSPAMKIHLG